MALSTSFSGGWFFGRQFFEDAAARIEKLASERRRTHEDMLRYRGKFHLDITPAEVIGNIAKRFIDEDDDEQLVAALYAELQSRYMDWHDEYRQQIIAERDRLVEERDERLEAEAAAKSDWLQRRRRATRGR